MKAYKIIARNQRTNMRIIQQQLDGREIQSLTEANMMAASLALQQSQRSGEQWVAVVEEYTTGQ